MVAALLVYAAGVLVGLGVMRDRFASRLVTALLWPLGPLAGLVVIAGLLVVAVALWPGPVLAAAAAAALLVYLLA